MDFVPPSPSLDNVPCPPLPDDFVVSSTPPAVDPFCCLYPHAPLMPVEPIEIRGRSTSRSPKGSPNPSRSPSPVPIHVDNFDTCYFSIPPPPVRYRRARSFSSSRSRSRSPLGRMSYVPSLRPSSPIMLPPPPPLPMYNSPPTPLPYQSPPQMPLSMRWPSLPTPVDILTFHYGDNMAYAPAAYTYDDAIDTALELWPELHAVDRDRISLLVKGPDQLVRVPKMAWYIVLCDLARYEVVRVQVDQLPPPPQYQGDEKGIDKSESVEKKDVDSKKPRRKGGLFSSIRRIFWR